MRRLTLALPLVLVLPALAGAQDKAPDQPGPRPIGAIAALTGKGTITHAAETQQTPVQVQDAVFVRDKIASAESSVIRVLMGGRITITIRERSVVTITDDPMRPRVDLESGKLAFRVHDGGLRAGEIAELRTPNAVTGIRGSLVIASVDGFDSEVTVLQAHKPITIAPRSNPAQTTTVPIGHTVRVTGPRTAPRIGKITPAAKEHLEKAADTAEVPGRAKDGGQERLLRFDPKVGRLITAEGKVLESRRVLAAPVGKALLQPEGKALTAPGAVTDRAGRLRESAGTLKEPAGKLRESVGAVREPVAPLKESVAPLKTPVEPRREVVQPRPSPAPAKAIQKAPDKRDDKDADTPVKRFGPLR